MVILYAIVYLIMSHRFCTEQWENGPVLFRLVVLASKPAGCREAVQTGAALFLQRFWRKQRSQGSCHDRQGGSGRVGVMVSKTTWRSERIAARDRKVLSCRRLLHLTEKRVSFATCGWSGGVALFIPHFGGVGVRKSHFACLCIPILCT